MDPRTSVIGKRIKDVKKTIAVTGAKGGIGKSMVSSVLALTLSGMGYKVGLFDLDFSSPSAHVILGIKGKFPKEDKGIIPPEVNGMKFMSISYFSGKEPSPMRGNDMTSALIEMLAITRWGELDFLVIDMPPGIGDAIFDTLEFMRNAEFLVLTTSSKLTLETTKKVLKLLKGLENPVLGVIENMKSGFSHLIENVLKSSKTRFLGSIEFDKDLEESIGDPEKLMATRFAKDLEKIARKIV